MGSTVKSSLHSDLPCSGVSEGTTLPLASPNVVGFSFYFDCVACYPLILRVYPFCVFVSLEVQGFVHAFYQSYCRCHYDVFINSFCLEYIAFAVLYFYG